MSFLNKVIDDLHYLEGFKDIFVHVIIKYLIEKPNTRLLKFLLYKFKPNDKIITLIYQQLTSNLQNNSTQPTLYNFFKCEKKPSTPYSKHKFLINNHMAKYYHFIYQSYKLINFIICDYKNIDERYIQRNLNSATFCNFKKKFFLFFRYN